MTEDPQEAALLDLLALLLQARPEWVTRFLLVDESPAVRATAAQISDTLSAVAMGLPAAALAKDEAGVDALRSRILASLAGRQKPRAALVVVDMLNDHLTVGSSVEVPRARDIVPALAARLDAARAAGLPVVYALDQHEPDDPDLDVWTTHNIRGSKGAEVWPPLAPQAGDRVIHKATYSAFTGSNLDAVLDELSVDTIILTGCLTEIGLSATAMDALQRGYAVEIPPDSQAGSGPVAEQVALKALSLMPPFAPARRDRLARTRAT